MGPCWGSTPVLWVRRFSQGEWAMMQISPPRDPAGGKFAWLLCGEARERDPMPEMPANQNMDSHEAAERFAAERLATPQELAEFGGAPADAATEAKIIALLEEQMARPEEEVPSVALAAALELFQEEIAEVKRENPVAAEKALVTEAIGGELSSMPEPVAGLQEALELYETPGPDSTGEGELLEFAEVLDQHKLWVETAGKEGKPGDF